jgi:hypothetical protein
VAHYRLAGEADDGVGVEGLAAALDNLGTHLGRFQDVGEELVVAAACAHRDTASSSTWAS